MPDVKESKKDLSKRYLPKWFKQDLPDIHKIRDMKNMFRNAKLHTVCEGAHCPNIGKCWDKGVATFMILGGTCTRSCKFCAVNSGVPDIVSVTEPMEVARMVKALALKYVVITSVTRDDLPDKGAEQFVRTVKEIKDTVPSIIVEILVPDFSNRNDLIRKIIASGADVIGHNIETVERIFKKVRPKADYKNSLEILTKLNLLNGSLVTKSGFMVGLGETDEEVMETIKDIYSCGCDILTIGQYLSPGIDGRNVDVKRFVPPDKFKEYKAFAEKIGFKYVLSDPLARSSFMAEQGYQEVLKRIEACEVTFGE